MLQKSQKVALLKRYFFSVTIATIFSECWATKNFGGGICDSMHKNLTMIRANHSTYSLKKLKVCRFKFLGSEVKVRRKVLTFNCVHTMKLIVRKMKINIVTDLILNLQRFKS
jgi:plasmid maintenance system killer protein